MAFSIGDKVMHPRFGGGEITGEEHRELVKGFEHYYVIKMLAARSTAYVPIGQMDQLGVRLVMTWAKLVQVMGILRSVPSALSNDHSERQAEVQVQLGSRLPIPVAQVVRDLSWRRKCKRLTQKDQAFLKHGRELLANEMALATDGDVMKAHEMIDGTLRTAWASGFGELEAAY